MALKDAIIIADAKSFYNEQRKHFAPIDGIAKFTHENTPFKTKRKPPHQILIELSVGINITTR